MTKISRKLEWLRKYLEIALPHLPPGVKITRLIAWGSLKGRYGKNCQACIYTHDDKNYRIYLHLVRHPRCEPKPSPYTQMEFLELLAHELAHTASFDHTPLHKKLEAKLLTVFMGQLHKEGYISEEEEINQKAKG